MFLSLSDICAGGAKWQNVHTNAISDGHLWGANICGAEVGLKFDALLCVRTSAVTVTL